MLPSVKANPLAAFDASFATSMAMLGLDQCDGYVTALSGGPDSTALALLTQRYAVANGKQHHAVIINHQLRDGAGDEAVRVQARLLAYDISSEIIPITAPRPASGLQEWARVNRHNMLLSVARQRQAALLFAHHAGDQAETVAMRLLKGSGLAGLAGIAVRRMQHDVIIGRPVLGWTPDQLSALCGLLGCDFEIDPSNHNTAFERVRIRNFLAGLDRPAAVSGGPSSVQLRRLADGAARLMAAAETACDQLAGSGVDWHKAGYATITMAAFDDVPQSLWALMMRRLIMAIGGGHYGPSATALCRTRQRLAEGRSATIGGCHFSPVDAAAKYRVFRETGRRRLALPVAAGEAVVFAGCWLVHSRQAGTLHALGDAAKLTADFTPRLAAKAVPDAWHLLPHRARRAIPVLTALDGGLIYPQLKGYENTQSPVSMAARFLGMARRPTFLADTLIG